MGVVVESDLKSLTGQPVNGVNGQQALFSPYVNVLQVFFLICLALGSYLLRRTLSNHTLTIGRISLFHLAIHDIKYQGILHNRTYPFTFTSKSIYLKFHFPTPSLPRWITFTSKSIFYQSSTSDISCSNLSVTCWIFPKLFRHTAGPWTNCEIDGLCIRIKKSKETPYFIRKLRENLVGAIVKGDIYRVDDFGTKIQFCGMNEDEDETVSTGNDSAHHGECSMDYPTTNDSGEVKDDCIGTTEGTFSIAPNNSPSPNIQPDLQSTPSSLKRSQDDEMRISAFARGIQLYNKEGRIYSFGSVDAQLRRNWVEERGTFVMIAKECRWISVHWPHERVKTISFFSQLLTSIVHFPYDLIHSLYYPMSTVNLYVPRLDIHFDEFRLRDAELTVQALSLIREQMYIKDIQWQDVFVDAISQAILGTWRE
ncbi:hypothetical protein ABKN59_003135 [Abortiporus biennis]